MGVSPGAAAAGTGPAAGAGATASATAATANNRRRLTRIGKAPEGNGSGSILTGDSRLGMPSGDHGRGNGVWRVRGFHPLPVRVLGRDPRRAERREPPGVPRYPGPD